MVFGVMEGWLEEQLRKHAAVSAAGGNVYDSLALRSALASVLLLKGQHSDAAAMYQEIFDSAQISLPENHPEIGALHDLPSSLCLQEHPSVKPFFTITCCPPHLNFLKSPGGHCVAVTAALNLAGAFVKLGRFQDALHMCMKSLEFQRQLKLKGLLPDNHPDIGSSRALVVDLELPRR